MTERPTDIQARRLHALVRAEQLRRIEAQPDVCHWACGPVDRTAGNPRPQWCLLAIGHLGSHEPAEKRERIRAQTRARVRRYRERGGGSERP
jgi:hypothetical protein